MATLYRKQGQAQVVDSQGNLQSFSGNLDSLPIYNQNTVQSSQIQPTNTLNISGLPMDNTSPSIEGDMAYFQGIQNKISTEEQALQQQRASANTDIESILRDLGGQGQEQLNLEQQYVNPLQTQIADITGQANVLIAEYKKAQQQYEKMKTDIEAGAGAKGLTTSAVMGQQGAVARAQASDLNVKASEIGLLQAQSLALQGKADLAQKQVDRAIDLKYKAKEQELAIKQFQLEQIKDGLTAEQTKRKEAQQFALKKEEDRIADAKANDKAVQEMALQGQQMGAPADLVARASKAKTKLEAAQILGRYAKDLDIELKKAQIAKVWSDAKKVDVVSGNLSDADVKRIDTSPQGKKLISLSSLYQKSQTYQNLVNEYGFKATGKAKALLDSAYADLKISWKEAANLGALTGPDVAIIEEAIKPTSGGASKFLSYKLSGGQGGVGGAIDQSLSKARKEALSQYKQLVTRNPKYSGSEYARSLISPFAKQYATVNIDTVPVGDIIETEDGFLLESLGNGQFSPI